MTDEKVAFDALHAFWLHMLRRVQHDANIQYYCGHMTETLRLCLDAYVALHPDVDREKIKDVILKNNRSSDADVIRLRKQNQMIARLTDSEALKKELVPILEDILFVSDEWGGSKLANWQWGRNTIVDGVEDAADAVIDHLRKVCAK
jgi:hypothetical protein